MRRAITLFILVVLLAALGVIAYDRRGVQEHWLFLTRERTALVLPLHEISQQWQEQSLREHFSGLQLDCYNNLPGQYLGQRSCFADLTSLNGYPAMAIAFHMNGGYVVRPTAHRTRSSPCRARTCAWRVGSCPTVRSSSTAIARATRCRSTRSCGRAIASAHAHLAGAATRGRPSDRLSASRVGCAQAPR
jgi:hypothetical protein